MHTYAHMQYHMHICAHMCTCAHVCTHIGGGGRGEHGAWSDEPPSRSQGSDAALPHVHVHNACACASPLRPKKVETRTAVHAHMHTCTRTYAICTMCTCTHARTCTYAHMLIMLHHRMHTHRVDRTLPWRREACAWFMGCTDLKLHVLCCRVVRITDRQGTWCTCISVMMCICACT